MQHLARADAEQGPLSIYVHLPFCREMCRFCGCNVVATHDRSRADSYLDLLEKEVALVTKHLPRRREVSQLHWGGGTPTFLDSKQLTRCHEILARSFHFTPDAELAIEIDPAITTKAQIETLAGLGFNRISMGVQDFDAKVQEVVGRIQGEKETADLVEAARRNGFKGVNLDLIYGLPYQTPETWHDTLQRILAIHPDRLAVFGFAYVPWAKPHQKLLPQEALPKTEQRVELFLAAAEAFTGAGYRLIGLDHFALESDELARAQREGYLTRNFQGYTVRPATDTMAFGMSSNLGHRRRLRPEFAQAEGLGRSRRRGRPPRRARGRRDGGRRAAPVRHQPRDVPPAPRPRRGGREVRRGSPARHRGVPPHRRRRTRLGRARHVRR